MIRRALAVLLAFVLAAASVIGFSQAASALVPGINIDLLHNDQVVQPGDEIPEGDELLIRVSYDADQPIDGTVLTITLPDNVTVPSSFPTNQAIQSVVNNGDGTLTVTFRDPIPEDVHEGAFALTLTAGPVDGNEPSEISWQIGTETGGVTFIIEDEVTPPTQVTESWSKAVNPNGLHNYYEFIVDGDGNYEFTGLNPDILDRTLTYTLVVNSPDERIDYPIADQLPAGLGLTGTFNATIRTYNPQIDTPYTFAPTVAGDDRSFSGTVDVPENSTLTITYTVVVTDIDALEAAILDMFADRGYGGGWVQIPRTNTATFGEDIERTATVNIGATVPGVGVGTAFSKTGSWTEQEVITDEDGNLTPPAEMTYTLRANLTPWDGSSNNFTLNYDVVITDTLPSQASWMTGATDFITVTGTGITLNNAGVCPATDTEFSTAANAGDYCLDGQTLMINVGRDNGTDVTFQVRAQLNSVVGLDAGPGTTILGGTSHLWPNEASFRYGETSVHTDDHDANVIELPEDREGGINDSSAFSKTGPSNDVRVNPGESAQVPYRFVIDTSRESIDPLTARIVDEIDTDVYDISDLSTIDVSGSYGGTALTADHFDLSIDSDGHLVIELSDEGKLLVGGLAEDQEWIIDLVLTTVPFEGKETFEIYNRATLFGNGVDPDYWSDDDSEATSFGDEAELRKRVFDSLEENWVAQLPSRTNDDGDLVESFVYSIELIPRGNYGSAFPVQIFPRADVLPAAVEFLGFVDLDTDGAPDLSTLSGGPKNMQGNVEAAYDAPARTVTIEQMPGTNLNPNQGRIVVYFAVEVLDTSAPIVNEIAGSSAIIVPFGGPSIDIEKWTIEGDDSGPEYDDAGVLLNDGYPGDFDGNNRKRLTPGVAQQIQFTISNDGLEPLIDVVVTDELTGGQGTLQDLECLFPDDTTGTTWEGVFEPGERFECTATLPALPAGATHQNTARVTAVGLFSGENVDDADEWNAFARALGDTGGSVPAAMIWGALLLVGLGGATILLGRRRTDVG